METVSIHVDFREHALFDRLTELGGTAIPITKENLMLGDIVFIGNSDAPLIIIERKTFADLFASVKDGRYDEQSLRLKESSGVAPHNILYLIEGITSQLSAEKQTLLYSIITSVSLFKGFSVLRATGVDESARIIVAMHTKIVRDFAKGKSFYYGADADASKSPSYASVAINKVKGANITPTNIGTMLLSQIPSVSSVTAEAIMNKYGQNFGAFYSAFMESGGDCLLDIKTAGNGKERKISSKCVAKIREYLGNPFYQSPL